jgi:stage II sporulation protein R
MKSAAGAVIACVLAFAVLICFVPRVNKAAAPKETADYLRLHIAANSNSARDQEVKYLVKQRIVSLITPLVGEGADPINVIAGNLAAIENAANQTLTDAGCGYSARAALSAEKFPTRVYRTADAETTLPSGEYDALVLELGAARGDNWFCVLYPPLCVSEETSTVRFSSKLLNWFKK